MSPLALGQVLTAQQAAALMAQSVPGGSVQQTFHNRDTGETQITGFIGFQPTGPGDVGYQYQLAARSDGTWQVGAVMPPVSYAAMKADAAGSHGWFDTVMGTYFPIAVSAALIFEGGSAAYEALTAAPEVIAPAVTPTTAALTTEQVTAATVQEAVKDSAIAVTNATSSGYVMSAEAEQIAASYEAFAVPAISDAAAETIAKTLVEEGVKKAVPMTVETLVKSGLSALQAATTINNLLHGKAPVRQYPNGQVYIPGQGYVNPSGTFQPATFLDNLQQSGLLLPLGGLLALTFITRK